MEKTMKKYFPLFVLPTLVAFLIAFVVPFVMGVYLSFCEFTTVTNAKFVGTANYIPIPATVRLPRRWAVTKSAW